jgi:superfamily II DNA or RNA helicase
MASKSDDQRNVLANNSHSLVASSAEDRFVDIFQEAVGFMGTQLLQPQRPFLDLDGNPRRIDYALLSPLDKYAFEVDGEYYHRSDSALVSAERHRDHLFRQNSLIHQGWKVYRWTDTELPLYRERVIDHLRLFLEREIAAGTLEKGDLLPLQEGGEFELREHQTEALAALQQFRANGKTIALLTHATGSGKTHVAINDARSLGLRTLYLAHTRQLPAQTAQRVATLWPAARTAIYQRRNHAEISNALVVLSTLQAVASNLSNFHPEEFGYIIVDEAHHAPAKTFQQVIQHFRPQFLLGLTATPERSDQQDLLLLFRETAHRLPLEEAIRRGILVPIRCIRVETNIDLHHVRFNGVDYRLNDLEQAIQIPARDELIVDVYLRHTPTRRAVCFCVNVDHAERMAAAFGRRGVAAASVSGRLAPAERDATLAAYEEGRIKVLCACDILTEGWDSPRTEVLLMARPTLSRIIYVQQLGRGTRKAPGKEYLLVFDFIDRTDRVAQSLNVHRLFRRDQYRPAALVEAPEDQMERERRQYETASGQLPSVVLGLNLFETSLQPVDVFRWQDEAAGLMPAAELARELRVDDATVRERVRRGELVPELRVPIGEREHFYFSRERLPDLLAHYQVQPLTAENMLELFIAYVKQGDMSSSYKPVLLLGMFHCADRSGRVRVQDLVSYFRDFYLERSRQRLRIEAPAISLSRVDELRDLEIERIIFKMPFEKFERKGFFVRPKDLALVSFHQPLWRRITPDDRTALETAAREQLREYYQRITAKLAR